MISRQELQVGGIQIRVSVPPTPKLPPTTHLSASTYSLFWSGATLKKFLIAEKLTYAMKSEPNIE